MDCLREELGLPIGTMLDTKGPEIRLVVFEYRCSHAAARRALYPDTGTGAGYRGTLLHHLWRTGPGSASGQPGADRRRSD
ncbi:MAG: hypothetical protein V8Q30_01570 [Acutalibacteraceae bacterium]